MTTIVMSDDDGAGQEVAKLVGAQLQLRIIERACLERGVARRLRISEPFWGRALESRLADWMLGSRLERAWRQEVCALALSDGVLIETAWVGPSLRRLKHVLCVHVCAETLAGKGSPHTDARKTEERVRLRSRRRARWASQLALYDLVLNSVRIPPAQCAEHVVRLATSTALWSTRGPRCGTGVQQGVDGASAGGVNARSDCAVRVGREHLKLAGTETTEQQIAVIEQHLRGGSGGRPPCWPRPPAGQWG